MDSFLANLPKLPDPEQMGEWDRAAINFGIPDAMLMENAGREIFRFIKEITGNLQNRSIGIFMGGGNNGGDAACVARHLADAGARPLIFHLKPLDSFSGAAAQHIQLALADNVPFLPFPAIGQKDMGMELLTSFCALTGSQPDFLVDGLLGTGFRGILKESLQDAIKAVNTLASVLKCPIYAIDIPSGLDGVTGQPAPVAIRATATVTLAAAKPGLVLPSAREWTGMLLVRSIGFPKAIEQKFKADWRLLDGRSLLQPHPLPAQSYKNMYGHVTVAGGARCYAGAAALSASAAIRMGAGLVTVCSPAQNTVLIKNGWPEIMTFPLYGSPAGYWPGHLPADLLDVLTASSTLVVGPGMGRDEDSQNFLAAILNMSKRPPTVFDADALAILARHPELLAHLTEFDILTPHPGEAGMLLGMPGSEIQADRAAALNRLMSISPAVAVLKGAVTLIGQTGYQFRIVCPYDIPQLAIGGSGDVLSGCIGAILAGKNAPPAFSSAAHGVAIHMMAGLALAKEFPARGNRASDIVNSLCHIEEFLQKLENVHTIDGLTPWP